MDESLVFVALLWAVACPVVFWCFLRPRAVEEKSGSVSADEALAWLISDCLENGERITTRNAPVFRVMHRTVVFDRTPLVTLRRTAWKNCLREWEWFMSGSSNVRDLHPSVWKWWKPWEDEDGNVTYNYSRQFRTFVGAEGEYDGIAGLIEGIKAHPYSRRHCLTTWNTSEMNSPRCPITNCHGSWIQFWVDEDNALHLDMTQRSVDVLVGVPHNWLQYWAFLMWMAHRTGKKVGTFTWTGIDVHVYEEHEKVAREVANALRAVKPSPALVYIPSGDEFVANDFSLDAEYAPVVDASARMIV